MRLPCGVLVPTILLSVLSSGVLSDCFGQVPPKVPETTAAPASILEEQPPFDKLELFGFLAAGPSNSYASQVIQARGTNFTPDATFIASFPLPGAQEILKNIRTRAARTTSPDRDAAYESLRRAFDAYRNRHFAAANNSYQQALQLAPNSATLHVAYAVNLMFSENYPAAEAQARQSLRLWPENADAHGSLALSLTAQKQFAEAESESREALRIFPEHHSGMFTLGVSLTYEQKYKEAIPVLQKLIAALPKMPEPRKFLGISLFETGEIAEGINQLSLYVKNTPADAEGHYYLGAALRAKNRSEEARAQFAEAFRLQSGNPIYEAAAHPDVKVGATDAVSGPNPEDGSISENVYTNRFFGFTYEFPKGWISQSPEAARAVLAAGQAFISTGDPTEVDIKKAAARNGHPLLYVVEGGTGNQPIQVKSVMVLAFDIRPAPELTAQSFLESIAQRYKQTGVPIAISGTPENIMIAGRGFWKTNLAAQTAMGSHFASEFVTENKGYLLMFVVGVPDPTSLREIEKSLESIRFLQISN